MSRTPAPLRRESEGSNYLRLTQGEECAGGSEGAGGGGGGEEKAGRPVQHGDLGQRDEKSFLSENLAP